MSALLPDDFLSELRVRTPIVSVVSRRVPLKKSGRLWEACCPFHTEKTPSFKVHDDPADQHFHCFSGDTRVITWDGTKTIAEMSGSNHRLLTRDGKWVDAPVRSFGVQPLLEIRLSRNGVKKSVFATRGHRWFTYRRRTPITTENLKFGHRLQSSFPKGEKVELDPHGVQHGIVFGDGTVDQKKWSLVNLHMYQRQRWQVREVLPTNRVEEVYCAQVPGEAAFALEDNILTGNCHGCGAHGDAISFVMRSQSIDFRAAVSQLAAEAGMTVPEPAETPQQAQRKARADLMAQVAVTFSHALRSGTGGKDARTYLAGRGLSEETVEAWDIGYAPPNATFADYGVSLEQAVDLGLATQADEGKAPRPLFHNRIMFPVRDIRGRIIGFSGRALTERQQPKYLNSYGFDRSRALFGIDKAAPAVKAGSPMLVVEGQMDVLTLHQAGICGAVAPMGTAVTPEQLEEMWRLCPRPVYCADGDEAGRRATVRLVNLVLPSFDATRSLAFAHLPDGSDPDSYVRKHGPGAFCGLVGRATSFSDAAYEIMRSRFRTADPTSRTALREHINQTAATIRNRIMASECQSYWTTRFFQDRRAPGRPVAAPPCDPPASLTEHARVLRSLETQIVEAAEAFAADSTSKAEKRLRLLVQERNRIRREGVGEAVTEGTEVIDA